MLQHIQPCRDNPRQGLSRKSNSRLSKNGNWPSFPKVPSLLQYVSSRAYFARVKIQSKIIRRIPRTDVGTMSGQGSRSNRKESLSKKTLAFESVKFTDKCCLGLVSRRWKARAEMTFNRCRPNRLRFFGRAVPARMCRCLENRFEEQHRSIMPHDQSRIVRVRATPGATLCLHS